MSSGNDRAANLDPSNVIFLNQVDEEEKEGQYLSCNSREDNENVSDNSKVFNIDKNLIPKKMQEMAQRQRVKQNENNIKKFDSVAASSMNASANFVNLSQLLVVNNDDERSEMYHCSESKSLSVADMTPKVNNNPENGSF